MNQCQDCYGKEFCQYVYCPVIKEYIEQRKLGHKEPNKGNNMNEIIDKVAAVTDGVEVKHFALALDKDGKEIRVEITPNGEFSQDVEDKPEPTPTLH